VDLLDIVARSRDEVYLEVAAKALAELARLGGHVAVDCGCGSRAYASIRGLIPTSRSMGLDVELVLADLEPSAVRSALAHVGGRAAHGVVCDLSQLPLRPGRWLGLYGSVLHELRAQGRLEGALAEASRCFAVVAGYDYVDPGGEVEVEALSGEVRGRVEALASMLGERLGHKCRLGLALDACLQLSLGQPPQHLHFTFTPDGIAEALARLGLEVRWLKLYDVWGEVVERLSPLGVNIPLKRPLMGRAAWVAVKEEG